MLPCPCGLMSATRLYIGKRAEQREQHQDERGERRQRAGGEKRDAGLVGQRREVVDAGEAHDLPPGVGVRRRGVRADRGS